MLRSTILVPGLLAGLVAFSQEERPRALFNDSAAITGGFLELGIHYTNVLSTDAVLVGLSGGIVLNKTWNIGLGAVFSTSVIKNPTYEQYLLDSTTTDTQGGLELRYGYGGLLIEPVLCHRSVVHVALPVLIGAGGVNYSYPAPNGSNSQRNRIQGQAYFVVEPGVELEVTIVRGFRIGVGGSYLYTSDLSLPETASDALRTATARLSLKIGGF